MKSLKSILYILCVALGFCACNSDDMVDLENRKFVRINHQPVVMAVGENYRASASFDSDETASQKFTWTIHDTSVATVVSNSDNTGTITGVAEGTTVVQIESADGKLKYFSDVEVQKDRITKVLVIGNEYSEDAVENTAENYLYKLSDAAGKKILIANLYIAGASLETHWNNAANKNATYEMRKVATNGSMVKKVNYSIIKAIREENWDYIIFQESGVLAGLSAGYQEYLPKLVEYVKGFSTNPDAKYGLHQTWAYAANATQENFDTYGRDQMKMYQAIVDAVASAKTQAGLDLIIPAGTAVQNGRTSYLGDRFTRDGALLNYEIGRFTVASTWYEVIFGNVLNNSFIPGAISAYDTELGKTAAAKAVADPNKVTLLADYIYPEPNDFPFERPIYIDFGWVHSPAPFNNYDNPGAGKQNNLKDDTGAESGFAIEVTEGFSGVLDRGMPNDLGLPFTASQDMFFADGNLGVPVSRFMLSNLNRDRKYTFMFYGAINDSNTETEYTVTGKNEEIAYLHTDFNPDRIAVVMNIIPREDATITITLRNGPNATHWAGFYCVNSMIIAPEGYSPF